MNLVDTHCHLTDQRLDDSNVVSAAQAAGVGRLVVPSTDLADAQKVVALCQRFSQVWGALGIYPGNVEEIDDLHWTLDQLEKLAANKKVVALGEIGMDGYWNERNLELQTEAFRSQLLLANKLELPVVIHSREAEKEIGQILAGLGKVPQGQFHCFGPDLEFLELVLGRGFYVSFCGNLTYKNAQGLRTAAIKTPLNRLLLETDSPYLPPEGKRGTVNTPANVKITAEFIAKLKGVTLEELAAVTSTNAQNLFRFTDHENNSSLDS